jgi:hypothetical protein
MVLASGQGNITLFFGATAMDWSKPTFDEIKMDAEIGSYQEDFEPVGERQRGQDGPTCTQPMPRPMTPG